MVKFRCLGSADDEIGGFEAMASLVSLKHLREAPRGRPSYA